MRRTAVVAILLASVASAMHARPALHRSPSSTPRACTQIHASLFNDDDRLKERQARYAKVAELYGLDPTKDSIEIANRAASSLPEEENGTWMDVAMCSLRNFCAVAAVLAVVGAIPGQASAATPAVLVADAETFDIIASLAVPLLIGGGLVAFAAANYEKLIDKLNDGR